MESLLSSVLQLKSLTLCRSLKFSQEYTVAFIVQQHNKYISNLMNLYYITEILIFKCMIASRVRGRRLRWVTQTNQTATTTRA